MFWTHAQKRTRSSIATGVALLALALAGCGATTSPAGAASATPPATATAPATTAATATVNTAGLPAGCADMAGLTLMRFGDLDVSQVAKTLSYPDWTIPQGTPNQPLQLSTSVTGSPVHGSVAVGSQGATDGYFTFLVCNLSTSQSHTLQSFSVRIASFTPSSGALSVWNPCNDGAYDAQTQSARTGGCGGGFSSDVFLQATFPGNASVGASVTIRAASAAPAGPNDPALLPYSLAPGHSVRMAATLTVPTTPGTYTFAFGITAGSASPTYFSTSSPTLYAPIALDWGGQNCTTAAMRAQIPTSTQDTEYICPPTA